jgi:RNA polymerase sigma-70 factor (ECF subfamily)
MSQPLPVPPPAPSDGESFSDLMRRLKAGDEKAATDLIRRYEPQIRRLVRLDSRLDFRLRRLADSEDICQSVLRLLWQYRDRLNFDGPGGLYKWLQTVSGHRVSREVRRQRAKRRDQHRVREGAAEDLDEVPDNSATPSGIASAGELLQKAREKFSPEELQLLELRETEGLSWEEIAAQVGKTPDALRKQLDRACARVCKELDLDEVDDE